MRIPVNRSQGLVFLLMTAIYCVIFASLSGLATENYYMARAFDTDESGKLNELYQMYINGSWQPLTYLYGTAHTYLAIILSHLLSLFKPINFVDVAVVGRFVNFLALVLTGFVFLIYGRSREYSRWFFLFIVSLYFVGMNFNFSINAKPEHLQVFFVVCSIFCLKSFFAKTRLITLFFAGLFSGLAFATKYAGGLLLACEALCLLWFVAQNPDLNGRIKKFLSWMSILMLGAMGGVALLGPYLIYDFPEVLDLLFFHSKVLGSGFILVGQKAWYDWFNVLLGQRVLWWGVALWLIPICVWTVKVQKPDWRRFPGRSVDILWVVFYMAYLCIAFREMNPRFLMVVLPFLFDLIFSKLGSMDVWLKSRGYQRFSHLMFLVVLLGVFYSASSSWGGASDVLSRTHSKRIEAGRWLSENVDHSSMIAYDFYTYVPPEFPRRFHRPYLTGYDVIRSQPDYLVSSLTIMSRYLEIDAAHNYRGGRDAFMRHYYLYFKLNTDSFPGYHLVQDFEEVRIYKNSKR